MPGHHKKRKPMPPDDQKPNRVLLAAWRVKDIFVERVVVIDPASFIGAD
jgi:hypothetical protein